LLRIRATSCKTGSLRHCAKRLDAAEELANWQIDNVFPPLAPKASPEEIRVTVDRVSNTKDKRVFDVVEGYWSPLDKHRSTPPSVARWVLKTIFVPLNDTARFPGGGKGDKGKALRDIAFVVAAIILALLLVILALVAAGVGYSGIIDAAHPKNAPTLDDAVLGNPLRAVASFSWQQRIAVLVGLAGAICLGQAISSLLGAKVVRRRRRPATGTTSVVERRKWLVFTVGFGLLLWASLWPVAGGHAFGIWLWFFLAGVLCLQGASSLGRGFLVDRIGDIQIYCNTDENSEYFKARLAIRTAVEKALLNVLLRRDLGTQKPNYDSIVVMGHSLGSTIGLDAIIRLHEIHEATSSDPSANLRITDDDWGRIRAFVTFGTSLEKTKYFFAAATPSFSAERERWSSRLYGHLFTADRSALNSDNDKRSPTESLGIFWANYWYYADIVANRIESYRSTVKPRV
jgi:hypothetical protein